MNFGHVQPRYLNPRADKNPPSRAPEQQTIPKNPQFRAVNSRYLEHKDPPPPRQIYVPPSPFYNPDEFKRAARAAGFGQAQSKYKEEGYPKDETSPREKLEHHKARTDSKELRGWRSPGTPMRADFTFDSVRRKTEERLGSPSRKSKINAPSTVKEFIRDGTPLKHHSQYHPPKTKFEDPNNQLPKWHAAGVAKKNFKDLEKETSRSQSQYVEMQDRVSEQVERLRQKQVPHDYRPRVAKLAPAYQVTQLEKESARRERVSGNGETNTNRSGHSPEPLDPFDEESGSHTEDQGPDAMGGQDKATGGGASRSISQEGEAADGKIDPLGKDIPLKWSMKGKPVF